MNRGAAACVNGAMGLEACRSTHNHEVVAPCRPGNAECAPLGALNTQGTRGAAEGEGYQFRGHCGVLLSGRISCLTSSSLVGKLA